MDPSTAVSHSNRSLVGIAFLITTLGLARLPVVPFFQQEPPASFLFSLASELIKKSEQHEPAYLSLSFFPRLRGPSKIRTHMCSAYGDYT